MLDDDALDATLLESGDIAQLLARYDGTVRAVCIARLKGHADADDVAQNVRARLFREFTRGRRYPVPYRVVVFQVIEWTVKGYFQKQRLHDELPEDWDAELLDPADEVVSRHYLEDLLAELPAREREVAMLRYIHHLEPSEIAEQLDIEPNNAYQALSRAHEKLRKAVNA